MSDVAEHKRKPIEMCWGSTRLVVPAAPARMSVTHVVVKRRPSDPEPRAYANSGWLTPEPVAA
jgi:hypothetical protein